MQWNSVVLPAPFGPMSPTISPRSIVSETSRLAIRPPKRLVQAVSSRSGAIALGNSEGGSAPLPSLPPKAGLRRRSRRSNERSRAFHSDRLLLAARALAARGAREPGRRVAREPGEPAAPRQREEPVGPPGGDHHDDGAVDDEIDAAPGERAGSERGRHELRDRDQDHRAEHRPP